MLLLLVQLVLAVGLLSADVETAANERVGINIVNAVAIDPLHELMRRQAVQHDLALRCVGWANDESGSGKIVFALRHDLLLRLACRQQAEGDQQSCHRSDFEIAIRFHM